MEKNGWLTSKAGSSRGPQAPRACKITKEGHTVLKIVRPLLRELGVEGGRH